VHRFGGELQVQLQQQQVLNIGLNISWLGLFTKKYIKYLNFNEKKYILKIPNH
jgi:hypothetical protein